MFRHRGSAFIVAVCCWVASPAGAATPVFVDAAGVCDGNAPCFTTIQAGVKNAGPGESIVLVYEGMYPESVDLTLMGMDIGSMPASIEILNAGLLDLGAATAPAQGATAGLPASATGLPARLRQAIEKARAAALAAIPPFLTGPSPSDPMAGIALPEVLINPAAGPAIFHSGAAYPGNMMRGDVSLFGLTVKSLTDGIRLGNVNGDISASLVTADGNGGRGLSLKASGLMMFNDEDIDVVGVSANGNGGAGVVADADGEIDAINVSADGNGMQGMLLTGRTVQVLAVPSVVVPFFAAPLASAIGNMATGIEIVSTEGATLGFIFFFEDLPPVVLEVTGNGGPGLDVTSGSDSVTVIGVKADGNLEGMRLLSQSSILVLGSSASGNTGGDGVDLTTTEMDMSDPDDPLDGVVAALIGVSANRNQASGFNVTAPNGGLALFSSTAIMNRDGVLLADLGTVGVGTLVNGNILCSNSASGLRLLDNVTVNAEGNWWGDVTGPFHAVKNPGGLGNPVVDGTNGGGAGDVDFQPFIDTITASASGTFIVNQNTVIEFQFSGGNGTVFLGIPDLGGFGNFLSLFVGLAFERPFTVSTDNGVLIDEDETGPTVESFVNQPMGIVRLRLKPDAAGPATITLDGPCNLDSSITVQIHPFSAPLLSLAGLIALAAALAFLGAAVVRRRAGAR